jgi:cold-inducible RNA-binding protein
MKFNSTNMTNKLFVGNLPSDVTENDLQDLFAQHGPVSDVNLVTDRATGRPRGFAFITMAAEDGASAAMQALDGKNVSGRPIRVSEARPREDRPLGPAGQGGGGGGRGFQRNRGYGGRR